MEVLISAYYVLWWKILQLLIFQIDINLLK